MASDIGLDAATWQFDEQQRLVITERSGRESAWDWISWGLVRIAYTVNHYFVPKCRSIGFCPEKHSCGRMPPRE